MSTKTTLLNDFTQFMRTVPIGLLHRQDFSVYRDNTWQGWFTDESRTASYKNNSELNEIRRVQYDTVDSTDQLATMFTFYVQNGELNILSDQGEPLKYRDALTGVANGGQDYSLLESKTWAITDYNWDTMEYPDTLTTRFHIPFRAQFYTTLTPLCSPMDVEDITCFHQPGELDGLFFLRGPLNPDLMQAFLDSYPVHKTQCCLNTSFSESICVGTNVSDPESATCETHMRDWCADVADHKANENYKPECACTSEYPSENKELVKSIEDSLIAAGVDDSPNKCLVPTCAAITAYKSQDMINSDCAIICDEVEKVIESKNQEIKNVDNLETIMCNAKRISLPVKDEPTKFPWIWVWIGIGIVAAIIIFIVVLAVALRKQNEQS
jgi:hypothetical protein